MSNSSRPSSTCQHSVSDIITTREKTNYISVYSHQATTDTDGVSLAAEAEYFAPLFA